MYTFAALQYRNILHPRPILTLSDDIKADSLNDLTKFQIKKLTENRAIAARSSRCRRTGIVQCQYDMSTGYGPTILKACITFFIQNRRGCGARESVRYRTALATSAQKWSYGQSMDIVTSWAKCKFGKNGALHVLYVRYFLNTLTVTT